MSLVVMGSSFKTAPLAMREKLAVPEQDMHRVLNDLVAYDGVSEAAVLGTCNRTEFYVDAKTDRIAIDSLNDYVVSRMGNDFDAEHFYVERGDDAAEHLLRVVCSLDSQVLGEAQILGQAKRAFQQATEAGTCGVVLTKLFKTALHLGKRVRTETAIGQDSVSLSTTAFKVARNFFGSLADRRIVLLGTGEMAQLCLKYLAQEGCTDVCVVGRNEERARICASLCPCTFVHFDERYEQIAQADVVFTMTAADEVVVRADKLAACLEHANRSDRALLMVDEALPRDVEQACGEVPGVTLHNLDTLATIIDERAFERLAAVGDVERLVGEAHHDYLSWMQQRQVNPTIKQMYEKYTATVQEQVAQAAKALSNARGSELSDEECKVLEALGSALVKRLLHGPTSRLRVEAETADSYYYTGAARYLFGLDTFPPDRPHVSCEHQCNVGRECPNRVPAIHQAQCAGRNSA